MADELNRLKNALDKMTNAHKKKDRNEALGHLREATRASAAVAQHTPTWPAEKQKSAVVQLDRLRDALKREQNNA